MSKTKHRLTAISTLLLLSAFPLLALEPKEPRVFEGDPYANESKAERDARMAWWREAKFGMFIHWGVYAVLAGDHNGYRDAEWIMRGGKIPVDEYRAYAKDFTAETYDPKAWVDLALKAGMRYMVITSKHHDGFALFPSEVTDWDVADATPYGKDLLAPLAEAARERGLKFGLYYSHAQDWMHPGGAKWRYEEGDGWDEAHKGSFDEYIHNIAVPQTREILTRYQPDVLWWDTPVWMNTERAEPLVRLLELQPSIIHNDRLGGGYHGDTETPENFIPPAGYPDGRDWETCMTMNENWGYVHDDDEWKSFDQLIFNLVDIVSKGGNYLLNVGPDATGQIPQESIDLLTQIGAWMEVNGEAIYGTKASPFLCRLPWGRCTLKTDDKNTILYLHLLDAPENGRVLLPGLQNKIVSANWLDSGSKLRIEPTAYGPVVVFRSEPSAVIKLRIKGKPEVVDIPTLPDADGVIRLTPVDADLKGELQASQSFGLDRIGGWQKTEDAAEWSIKAQTSGTYRLRIKATTPEEDAKLRVTTPAAYFMVDVEPTKRWRRDYREYTLGGIRLEKGQLFNVRISTEVGNPKTVYVNTIELIPEE